MKPLSVPKIIYSFEYMQYIVLFILLKRMEGQCIVFVPSKKMAKNLYFVFQKLLNCRYVYSDYEKRREVIDDFRNGKCRYLFSTTVLERGLTFYGVSVIVCYKKPHFDKGSLIQMLGRVGRGVGYKEGVSYVLSDKKDKTIKEMMSYLKEANSYL